jgi:hypothetical protein
MMSQCYHSICARVSWDNGGMMQCLACGAKMLLMDVVHDYTTKVPAFERHIFKCSACPQIARRLVFSRAKMPVTHLPVITTPTNNLWNGCVAAPSTWVKAVETLRSRQIDLKEKAAAAKTAAWAKAVERLRSKQTALAEQAAVASHLGLTEPVQAADLPPVRATCDFSSGTAK